MATQTQTTKWMPRHELKGARFQAHLLLCRLLLLRCLRLRLRGCPSALRLRVCPSPSLRAPPATRLSRGTSMTADSDQPRTRTHARLPCVLKLCQVCSNLYTQCTSIVSSPRAACGQMTGCQHECYAGPCCTFRLHNRQFRRCGDRGGGARHITVPMCWSVHVFKGFTHSAPRTMLVPVLRQT